MFKLRRPPFHHLVATIALAMMAMTPLTLHAHCDALDGSVVTEAIAALEKGEVTPVLKWITAEDEAELTAAFEQTLVVRQEGAEARELADRFFLETLVRLHRESEGAPFTGLKPAGTGVDPAVAAADRALEEESAEHLIAAITAKVEEGLRERFEQAVEARHHAEENVDAGRDFVHKYVEFVHFTKYLHQAAGGHGNGHGGHEAHAHE